MLLARAGFVPESPPAVLIPVGTPGLDHPGSVYRTDGIAALPLRRLRPGPLPTAAEVLTRLAAVVGA